MCIRDRCGDLADHTLRQTTLRIICRLRCCTTDEEAWQVLQPIQDDDDDDDQTQTPTNNDGRDTSFDDETSLGGASDGTFFVYTLVCYWSL